MHNDHNPNSVLSESFLFVLQNGSQMSLQLAYKENDPNDTHTV